MNEDLSGKIISGVAGAATGVLTFIGLSLWFGHSFVPTVQALPTYPNVEEESPTKKFHDQLQPKVDPITQLYLTNCSTCHQADGKGLAGTFPPLAGSSWVNQDPETPIRIVIMGLSGAIEVEGQKFNSAMPPPAGLDDEKIATILTYVRSNFGNKASAVDAAKVAEVRAAISARGKPWSADELTALRAPAAVPTPAPSEQPTAAPEGAAVPPAQP